MKDFSNLAKIVFKRTYSRQKENGQLESWQDTCERVIAGNVKGHNVDEKEAKALLKLLRERKAGPAGRGIWFSGAPQADRIGGRALTNCWFFTADRLENYVIAMDLLMLGGGVGLSVENRYSSKLPKVKKAVTITHKPTNDADFIIPDSREGWCRLLELILEAYFETGKSFSYSTICIRGKGELIKGFGGVSSGPVSIVSFVDTLSGILNARAGKSLNPVDAADVLTTIAELIISCNIRRSATIILGDCYDKDFLRIKRWDIATIPPHRSNANYSVVCDDIDDLHPLFWKTYEFGEPLGIVNRKNIQKYGRMGELKKDTAIGTNPCAEATLESGEPCNLTELVLPNFKKNEEEFIEAARLMHRYAKRVTMADYHHEKCNDVIKRNRRVGCGITGCLASPLFTPEILDKAYKAIQDENVTYSKELNIPQSIRTTVVKPSGTWSKLADCGGYDGVHAAYSRYMIQRIRFSSNDPLIAKLKEAGHQIEPVMKFDGSIDRNTLVVDFYMAAPEGYPVADEDFSTWQQLDTVLMAQKNWADQSVSTTVYYKKEDIPAVKEWLSNNLCNIKTISFLLHSEHGFLQAPKESITKEQYEKLSTKVKSIQEDEIQEGEMETNECLTGSCPIK